MKERFRQRGKKGKQQADRNGQIKAVDNDRAYPVRPLGTEVLSYKGIGKTNGAQEEGHDGILQNPRRHGGGASLGRIARKENAVDKVKDRPQPRAGHQGERDGQNLAPTAGRKL